MTRKPPTFGFVSTAPPTSCGIATFTTALGSALERHGYGVNLVRIVDKFDRGTISPMRVVGELLATDPSSIARSVEALNRCDVAVIQHEYGLYGGRDGSDVLRVLDGLRVPSVAILHTVLPLPTRHQMEVLNELLAKVDAVVVMTTSAKNLLARVNHIGSTPVGVIAHGAAMVSKTATRQFGATPELLTWGLIGPGKGIEWVLDSLVSLRDLDPTPHYVVSGRTHPKVLAASGESYRRMLEQRAIANGVRDLVRFDNTYHDLSSLAAVIAKADVVILPYDSSEQATSGVLVDAVAAGKPVIATTFPHSIELLSTGAGLLVPHRDSSALTAAIRAVVTDPALTSSMVREARRLAPTLSWDAVADQYISLSQRFLSHVAIGA